MFFGYFLALDFSFCYVSFSDSYDSLFLFYLKHSLELNISFSWKSDAQQSVQRYTV